MMACPIWAHELKVFNSDLNQWDVGGNDVQRVADYMFVHMFSVATQFNGDVTGWDVRQLCAILLSSAAHHRVSFETHALHTDIPWGEHSSTGMSSSTATNQRTSVRAAMAIATFGTLRVNDFR